MCRDFSPDVLESFSHGLPNSTHPSFSSYSGILHSSQRNDTSEIQFPRSYRPAGTISQRIYSAFDVHVPRYFRNNIYIVNEKSWRAAELRSLFTALAELRKKFKGRLRFSQARRARLSHSVSATAATKRGRFRQRFPPGEAVK